MSAHSRCGRATALVVDEAALAANARLLLGKLGRGTLLIPALKADAYGFGIARATRVLHGEVGLQWLATGTLDDALTARAAAPFARILLYGGWAPSALPTIVATRITPTVWSRTSAQAVAAVAPEPPLAVHVEVDCGLRRLGVPVDEAAAFIDELHSTPGIEVEGLYTHVPFGTDEGVAISARQLERFDELIVTLRSAGTLPPVTQARASACLAAGLADRAGAVSPGHALFGLRAPAPSQLPAWMAGLRPTCHGLRSAIVGRSTAPPGRMRPSAYGQVAPTMGVVPVGRADGMAVAPPRTLDFAIGGRSARVLGVSLEHTTLDLGGGGKPGDEAWVGLSELAAAGDRSELDVLLAFRVERVDVHDVDLPADGSTGSAASRATTEDMSPVADAAAEPA